MPRAPAHFNNSTEEEQYFGSDARTWNTSSVPLHQGMGPPQTTGTNFSQVASNPRGSQLMQMTGQMPPSPFVPRQNYQNIPRSFPNNTAVPPPRAPTQIDSRPPDYWHTNKYLMCINKGNEAEYPHSVSYRPTSGPCTHGVAMLNLELGRGMVHPNALLNEFMPLELMHFASGALLLDWPGYSQVSYVLTLIDPRTGRHVTRAMLGAQVTQHFKDFVNTRKDKDFNDHLEHGIEVGIDGVVYDQVRLVDLYTRDGMSYRPQFALNAHFLTEINWIILASPNIPLATLQTTNSSGVMNIVIDSTSTINLFDFHLQADLANLIETLQANDTDIRVVVFSSANPDFFIAHFDIIEVFPGFEGPSAHRRHASSCANPCRDTSAYPSNWVNRVFGTSAELKDYVQALSARLALPRTGDCGGEGGDERGQPPPDECPHPIQNIFDTLAVTPVVLGEVCRRDE
ncbi:hypothetical protein DFH07DRAFT_970007 [Mycena maculata]|uniref:Uncharacterized protein n=1 Tax=Mycena maculata TaxID=230809 RepID=A0AAD7HTH3_9AGAR|nr:hypothetical protein DFH07DRAFT_970007 [Mycena maculata]